MHFVYLEIWKSTPVLYTRMLFTRLCICVSVGRFCSPFATLCLTPWSSLVQLWKKLHWNNKTQKTRIINVTSQIIMHFSNQMNLFWWVFFLVSLLPQNTQYKIRICTKKSFFISIPIIYLFQKWDLTISIFLVVPSCENSG